MGYLAAHPHEGLLRLAVLKARPVKSQPWGTAIVTLELWGHDITRLGKIPVFAAEDGERALEVIESSPSRRETWQPTRLPLKD